MLLRRLVRAASGAARQKRAATRTSVRPDLEAIRGHPGRYQERRVLVLGAGMAGLACAYELGRLGFQVVVLEADPGHIGGRVRTHRTASGSTMLHAELGAMRIPEGHDLSNLYIEEFGLHTRPFVMSNPDAYLAIRGQALRMQTVRDDEHVAMSLFALTPEERRLGTDGLWERAVLSVLDGLSADQKKQLYEDRIRDPRVRALDHKCLATALHDAGLSNEAREYVMTTIGLETALPIALTEHLREESEEVWLGRFSEIVGGTDRLATAFVDEMPGDVDIRNGCRVTGIAACGRDQATAVYVDENGGTHRETADWLICTLPLGVLNRLDIESAFSPRKRRAIQGVNYDPSTKVIGHAPYRWWEREDGIYGGGTMYDTQMGSTWYPADNVDRNAEISRTPSLFLASYTWGQLARRIASVPERQLDDVIRQELGRVHPQVVAEPSLYQTEIRWAWDQQPLYAGAYAFFMPGEHTRFYEALVEPDGRVLLAGEHVSHTHSWIQGAFESAVRAMGHLLDVEDANP